VRYFVGITDRDWFDFLSRLNGLDEVNFWQPSAQQQFRALQIGEPAKAQGSTAICQVPEMAQRQRVLQLK
jgi:hypothetical protein